MGCNFQAHLFISGFVQGVGFRYFVRDAAKERSINGWVRNLPDNRVEAVFQGEKKTIEDLITVCKKGPYLSEVRTVDVAWEDAGRIYGDFSILR